MRFSVIVAAGWASALILAAGCGDAEDANACVSSTDCASGLRCVDGTCTAPPDGAPPDICEPSCECIVDSTCATGFGCVDSRCVDGECFHRTDDTMCAADEICSSESGCVTGTPVVDSGADSSAPDAGDTGAPADTGAADTGVVGSSIGQPCVEDSDCAAVGALPGLCLLRDSGFDDFDGGYCSAICELGAMQCGSGAECVDRYEEPVCLVTCAVDSDCREEDGYNCRRVSASSETRYCRP